MQRVPWTSGRRARLIALLVASVFATVSTAATAASPAAVALTKCRTTMPSMEVVRGRLTVATDNPVSSPWYVDNHPSNGQGYESGLVYGIARELGVVRHDVSWVDQTFATSYLPGEKHFDFDANEVTYSAALARNVTFSSSYFAVHQALVALTGDPIVTAHSPRDLRTYRYGDLAGTVGLAYITQRIRPTIAVHSYSTMTALIEALKSGAIDALVIDVPTGDYMTTSQLVNAAGAPIATVVGQFPSTGDHYGLVFQHGNPLAGCVDLALAALRADGTIERLTHRWLSVYSAIPTIAP